MDKRVTMYISNSGLERAKFGVEFLAVKTPTIYHCFEISVDVNDIKRDEESEEFYWITSTESVQLN